MLKYYLKYKVYDTTSTEYIQFVLNSLIYLVMYHSHDLLEQLTLGRIAQRVEPTCVLCIQSSSAAQLMINS